MEDKKPRQPILVEIGKVKRPAEEPFLPLWLFQHDDVIAAIDSGKRIERENLVNTLNRIHFMGGFIYALLRHPKYEEQILVQAMPDRIEEDKVICLWDKSQTSFDLETFQFTYLIVMDHKSIIVIPARLLNIDSAGFRVLLPEESYVISRRGTDRFSCRDVTAEITQHGFITTGKLVDFSHLAFRIKVSPDMPASHHTFGPDATVTIKLMSEGKMLFSGDCRCIRQKQDVYGWEIVLAPLKEQIRRFQTRKIRHPRRQIHPPPMAVFEHPFFKRKVQREITDISITGFSVYDETREGILMPGMVIHELSIVYAGELKMNCTAQVLYRRKHENETLCGIAILDMDIHSYSRLNRIISLNADHHSYVSTEVDMDTLWEFFFDTGFIYPEKYNLLKNYREEFKETYRKLYQDNTEIAMHFTYERNGHIYGHMSMIRAYERAWLIHHHAAKAMEKKRPGFLVLKQMVQFLYAMCRLPSAKLDYIMVYFRPSNLFPNRVFGDFAREMNNPYICTLDLFSYMTYPVRQPQHQLPQDWSLHQTTRSEIWELEQFYKHVSGGLLMDVLNLSQRDISDESLENVAKRYGCVRKWTAYSLAHRGNLKAVLIVNQSDVGVNLSELLNGVQAIVVDEDSMPWDVLSCAVEQLTDVYQVDTIPLLIYPSTYADIKSIPREKEYQLWILNALHHPSEFPEYMQRRFKMNYE